MGLPINIDDSGLYFRPRDIKIDWKKIASINFDSFSLSRDYDKIQQNILNITYCNIEQELGVNQNFAKLFKVAQYTIEYLLFTQDQLLKKIKLIQINYQDIYKDVVMDQKTMSFTKKKVFDLKKEIYRNRQIIKSYKDIFVLCGINKKEINEIIHKCPYCKKSFISDEYLTSHLERKHYDEIRKPPNKENYEMEKPEQSKINEITGIIQKVVDMQESKYLNEMKCFKHTLNQQMKHIADDVIDLVQNKLSIPKQNSISKDYDNSQNDVHQDIKYNDNEIQLDFSKPDTTFLVKSSSNEMKGVNEIETIKNLENKLHKFEEMQEERFNIQENRWKNQFENVEAFYKKRLHDILKSYPVELTKTSDNVLDAKNLSNNSSIERKRDQNKKKKRKRQQRDRQKGEGNHVRWQNNRELSRNPPYYNWEINDRWNNRRYDSMPTLHEIMPLHPYPLLSQTKLPPFFPSPYNSGPQIPGYLQKIRQKIKLQPSNFQGEREERSKQFSPIQTENKFMKLKSKLARMFDEPLFRDKRFPPSNELQRIERTRDVIGPFPNQSQDETEDEEMKKGGESTYTISSSSSPSSSNSNLHPPPKKKDSFPSLQSPQSSSKDSAVSSQSPYYSSSNSPKSKIKIPPPSSKTTKIKETKSAQNNDKKSKNDEISTSSSSSIFSIPKQQPPISHSTRPKNDAKELGKQEIVKNVIKKPEIYKVPYSMNPLDDQFSSSTEDSKSSSDLKKRGAITTKPTLKFSTPIKAAN